MSQTPPGRITAQIVAADGWPIAHAVLTVLSRDGRQIARAEGDLKGVVVTDPITVGNYTAIATAAGFEPSVQNMRLSSAEDTQLGILRLSREAGGQLPGAGTWIVDPQHSSIMFASRHLGISGVRGRFTEFSGTVQVAEPIEWSSVSAEIKAASIETDNAMRDRHLRSADFLDVETHPLLTFEASQLTPLSGQRWILGGLLFLHGVTRAIEIELTYLGVADDPWGGQRAGFHATAELRREDFDITFDNRLLSGIAQVGAVVRIELEIQAVWHDP